MRYYARTDTHFIEIRGTQYNELNAHIKRISAHLKHLSDKGHEEERVHLLERRRSLVQERWRSQCYVEIPASDIPENAHIRPIYDRPERVVTVTPKLYRQLLDSLEQPYEGET